MPRASAVVVFTVTMPSFSTCTAMEAGSAFSYSTLKAIWAVSSPRRV